MSNVIGFTTTIPVEVILAAGKTPVDLNNLFINDPMPDKLIQKAEVAGFPANVCGWIKGIYGIAHKYEIKKVIAVTQGDCSYTHALMEIFENEKFEIIPFAYPYDRDEKLLKLQIEELMDHFEVELDEVEEVRKDLRPLRENLARIDELSYTTGQVSSRENHRYLVGGADFNSLVNEFAYEVEDFLKQLPRASTEFDETIRLGYLGVPPIMSDFFEAVESCGARIVYNELARQFAMLTDYGDIFTQYRNYTYPYKVFFRLEEINEAIKMRNIQGLIHYTQSFCFRQLEDIIIRQYVDIPILTIDGNSPGPVDNQTRLRLESFCEMLSS